MAYAARAFAGAPIKQTGLQKLVRCNPVHLLPTLLSNVPLVFPPDIFYTSCYRHQKASLSLTTSLHLTALCFTFSVTSAAYFGAQGDSD